MDSNSIYANTSDEDCEPIVGSECFLPCEARSIKRAIIHLLTTADYSAMRRDWQQQGIVRASLLRGYIGRRLPYVGMRGSDRSSRLDEVMELIVGDAIMSPLSATEAIVQLGENVRNTGSFLRLLPQGLAKLSWIAGEPVEPVSLGFSAPPAAAE